MAVSELELIKQQSIVLSVSEKIDLAEYLLEQAKKDKQVASVNGQMSAPDPDRREEYEWLKLHRDEYAGQYVALLGNRLVAQAEALGELHRLVRESGACRPLFVRVESPDELPFGGW